MAGKQREVKQHVHEHLRKRSVNPDDVPDSVIVVLNDCTPDELKAMDRVGAAMAAEKIEPPAQVSMVH
jgi:hypothetical protein